MQAIHIKKEAASVLRQPLFIIVYLFCILDQNRLYVVSNLKFVFVYNIEFQLHIRNNNILSR